MKDKMISSRHRMLQEFYCNRHVSLRKGGELLRESEITNDFTLVSDEDEIDEHGFNKREVKNLIEVSRF